MINFESIVSNLDIVNACTTEELEKTLLLLDRYAILVHQSKQNLKECNLISFETYQQPLSSFMNLAIAYDHDRVCQYIAARLERTEHTMLLLKIMDITLERVRSLPKYGDLYYRILHAKYFDFTCDTVLHVARRSQVSLSTYYRYISKAETYFSAIMWRIIVPDILSSETDSTLLLSECTEK